MASGKLLASLPARPPTPPKDFSSSDPIIPTHEVKGLSATLLDTPETPTVFVPEYFAINSPSRGTKRKRVNFILTPTHHESDVPSSPPSLPTISPNSERPPLLPRQSNSLAKPTKSILKAARNGLLADASLNSDDLFQFNFRSPLIFKSDQVKMIDEICHQLERPDKSARLAAYQTLFSSLRADPDIADLDDFKRRLSLLTTYIQRDLNSTGGSDHRDGQIGVEALKVMNTLAWKNVLLESTLTSLMDWCISSLANTRLSKAVVNNMLLLLTCIKSDKVFTSSRAGKLFDVLKDLHLRVNGKQVLILRLDIYRKLLAQKQPTMMSGARVWLRHLFDALLKDKKEFVQHGLALGREAAVTYGTSKEISKSLMAVFQEPASSSEGKEEDANGNDGQNVSSGKTFANLFIPALNRFLTERDSSERVPRIWSLVVLFLRHRSAHFRKWEYWGQWLTLLQKCFNSSDNTLKGLANAAWRDFVWASQDDILREPSVRKRLLRPILGQLERDDREKSKSEAESAFCALIYYTLRPGTGDQGMKIAWDEYVLQAFTPPRPGNSRLAAAVLHSLLGSDEQKSWDRDLALQSQKIGPGCLLRLDPHWICANIESILSVIDGYMCLVEVDRSPASGTPINVDLQMGNWDRLLGSVAEVSRREVRPSGQTVKSIAFILTFAFGRIAATALTNQSYQLAVQLLATVVSHSRNLPLNHKCLQQYGTQIRYAGTTSNGSEGDVPVSSPLQLILEFLAPSCTSRWAMSTCADQFSKAVDARLSSISTRHASFTSLATMSNLCVCDHPERLCGESETHLCHKQFLWSDIACRFAELVGDPSQDSSGSQQHGEDLASGIQILVNGLRHGLNVAEDWKEVLQKLADMAESVSGTAGLASAVLAPLATEMMKDEYTECRGNRPNVYLAFHLKILELIPAPVGENEMIIAQKKLWGASMPRIDCRSDSFEAIFSFLTQCLLSSDRSLVLSAAQSWNRLQSSMEEVHVARHTFMALKRAARVTHIDLDRVSGNSILESPGGHLPSVVLQEDFDALPASRTSPKNNRIDEILPSVIEETVQYGLQTTPIKPVCSARIDDLAIELPSSPPDFHLPKISPSNCRYTQNVQDTTLIEDDPLPALPSSDEIERLDSSPTPATRRPSHSQSDLGALPLPSSSPAQPMEKFDTNSDPLGKFTILDDDSTPTRAHKTRSKRNRKEGPKLVSKGLPTNQSSQGFNQDQASGSPCHRFEGSVGIDAPMEPEQEDILAKGGAVKKLHGTQRRTSSRKRIRETLDNEIAESGTRASSSHPDLSPTGDEVSTRNSKVTRIVNANHSTSGDAKQMDGVKGTKRARGRPRKSITKRTMLPEDRESRPNCTLAHEDSDMEDCIIVGSLEIPKTSQASPASQPHTPNRSSDTTLANVRAMQDKSAESHTECHTAEKMLSSGTPGRMMKKRKREREWVVTDKEAVKHDLGGNVTAEPLQGRLQASVEQDEHYQQQPPSKKQRLSLTPGRPPRTPDQNNRSSNSTPASALSLTAQNILARLRGLLGDVQKVVLGRSEAREIHRTLNQLNSAAIDAEERGS